MASIFGQSTNRKKFSLENVLHLTQQVSSLRAQLLEAAETGADDSVAVSSIVEVLRELVEVVVWGDKHEEAVFYVFLEQDVMQWFREMAVDANTPSVVKVQLIQCVTILLQNLTNESSVFSVCSKNHINRMILLDIDPDDEELQSNYVSFLKTLCLRLNNSSVQFFFQRKGLDITVKPLAENSPAPLSMSQTFPLLAMALKLLSSGDSIVRAAARQIVITVVQLQDAEVTAFLLDGVMQHVLQHIVALIGDQVRWISKRLEGRAQLPPPPPSSVSATPAASPQGSPSRPLPPWGTLALLDNRVEDVVDDLFYINDFFDVPHAFVPAILLEVISADLVNAIIVPSIDAALDAKRMPQDVGPGLVTPATALLILAHWLKVNTVAVIHERLCSVAFGPGASLQDSRLINILTSPSLISLHPVALAVLQSVWCSKLLSDDVRQKIAGPSAGDAAVIFPAPGDAVPEACEWRGLRSTFGEYKLVLQRGRQLEVDTNGQSLLEIPDDVKRLPAVNALALSLLQQITQKEFTRMASVQLNVVLLLAIGRVACSTVSLERVITGAAVLCQANLVQRVETYRQHLWMLYGCIGENSVLTPSSLLCQFLTRDGDREIADPLEVVFARMERDGPSAVATFASPQLFPAAIMSISSLSNVKLGLDIAMAAPLLPALACWNSARSTHLEGDLCSAERNVNSFLDLQQRSNSNVALPRRAPQDEDEIEYLEVAVWAVLRHVLFTQFHSATVDPMWSAVAQFQCKRHARDEVRAWELAANVSAPGIRCEYSPDHSATSSPSTALPAPAPGTVLYLFVDGPDIFLVEPRADSPESQGSIVCSLRAVYSEALIHSKQLFKLQVIQDAPTARQKFCIVVRDRSVCQQIAQLVQKRAATLKHDAAALVWRLLQDDPLRKSKHLFSVC